MLDVATTPRIHTPQRDTALASEIAPTPSGNRHAGPRWHVVYTHPQAERRATQHLTEQGYAAYLPMVVVRRRDNAIRSLLHRVAVPMFPRYCFVHFDAQRDPWRPIIHTLGVRALLCRPDGTPDPCPEAALEAVRAAEALAATQPPASRQWAPGMPCSLPRGYAFEGLPAVVLAVEQDEARICIMFLGQLREITVDANCLMARDE